MSLKIYPVVLELVRRRSPLIRVLRARSSALPDQMERALMSNPLNTAAAAYSRGKNRRARFQSAGFGPGNARLLGNRRGHGLYRAIDPELRALFHHVIGTLVRLIEPRR